MHNVNYYLTRVLFIYLALFPSIVIAQSSEGNESWFPDKTTSQNPTWSFNNTDWEKAPSPTQEPTNQQNEATTIQLGSAPRTTQTDSSAAQPKSKTSGFELKAGISMPCNISKGYVLSSNNNTTTYTKKTYLALGPATSLVMGYRWKFIGIYLTQSFGMLAYKGKTLNTMFVNQTIEHKLTDDMRDYFGATYFSVRAFTNPSESLSIPFNLGLGAFYGGDIAIPFPNTSSIGYAFSMTLGAGLEYKFKSQFKLGFDLNYSFAVARYHERNSTVSKVIHNITPSLFFGSTY